MKKRMNMPTSKSKNIIIPSTLNDIVRGNLLFIDKTPEIVKITQLPQTFKFIGRPRHFGKSIAVDILYNLFSGNVEIFQKLNAKCLNTWNFSQQFPVLKLNLNFTIESSEKFFESVRCYLITIAKMHSIPIFPQDNRKWYEIFIDILMKITNKQTQKIVILIDNFDYCLFTLNQGMPDKEFTTFLSQIILICTKFKNNIHSLICFGICYSKFTFGNEINLADFTDDPTISNAFGFTREDILSLGDEYISNLLHVLLSFNAPNILNPFHNAIDIVDYLEYNYGGYRFSPDSPNTVINPYEVLSIFQNCLFDNYWLKSIAQDTYVDKSQQALSNFLDIIRPQCNLNGFANDLIRLIKGKRLSPSAATKYQFLINYGFLTYSIPNPINENIVSVPNVSVMQFLASILIGCLSEKISNETKDIVMKCNMADYQKFLRTIILKSVKNTFKPKYQISSRDIWDLNIFSFFVLNQYSLNLKVPHSDEYLLGICESDLCTVYLFLSNTFQSAHEAFFNLVSQYSVSVFSNENMPQRLFFCLILGKQIGQSMRFDVVINNNCEIANVLSFVRSNQVCKGDSSKMNPNFIDEMTVVAPLEESKPVDNNKLISFIDVVMQSLLELDSKSKGPTITNGNWFSAEQIAELTGRLFSDSFPYDKMLSQVKLSLQYLFETRKINRSMKGKQYLYGIK